MRNGTRKTGKTPETTGRSAAPVANLEPGPTPPPGVSWNTARVIRAAVERASRQDLDESREMSDFYLSQYAG